VLRRFLLSIKAREVFDFKGLYDPDCSGETFRVLKEKEEREFGSTGGDALFCRLGIGYA